VLFVDDMARRGVVNSLIIATVGATVAVVLCLSLALFVQRTLLPGRQGIIAIAMLPVTVPGIVLGVGFLLAFVATPLYGTIWVIALAYVIHYLPVGVKNTDALVQSISRELDESARVSGASWRQAMMKILVPLAAPGLASVWILLFVIFIREVSASIMLYTYGTETMSVALIRIMDFEPYGVSGAFGVLQTIMLLVCVGLLRLVPTGQKI
jgi:iron(III) transport system permease protein